MRFTPKTEEECSNLLPEGEYPFIVLEAEDKQSKAGNDMLFLKLGVEDATGSQHGILDYIVEAAAYKLRHLCDATGLLAEYEKGHVPAEMFVNRTGKCKIRVKPADGQYDAKNEVRDYVKSGKANGKTEFAPTHQDVKAAVKGLKKDQRNEMDDDIPF